MTIDAKELREAIDAVRNWKECAWPGRHAPMTDLVIAAASAHLASLPREVEIGRWVVLGPDGTVHGLCLSENSARSFLIGDGDQVVRLTGRGTPTTAEGLAPMTEEEAKTKWCPFARSFYWAGTESNGQAVSVNRYVSEGDEVDGKPHAIPTTPHADCFCLGSECMAFRWRKGSSFSKPGDDAPRNRVDFYCGLAGKP